MTDQTDKDLAPVSLERVITELKKVTAQRSSGELTRNEYEHRFARMISELRDRRIGGDRKAIMEALKPMRESGEIAPAEIERFCAQLGLS